MSRRPAHCTQADIARGCSVMTKQLPFTQERIKRAVAGSAADQQKERAIMVERLENAIGVVAYAICTYNEVEYAPLLDRLEKELAYYKERRDPVSRARAILQVSSYRVRDIARYG